MASKGRVSCGLDIEFDGDIEAAIEYSSSNGFDFVCSSIVKPDCDQVLNETSLDNRIGGKTRVPFLLNGNDWSTLVVGKLSHLPDLNSHDNEKRMIAEEKVRQQLEFVAFLSLPAIIVNLDSGNCSNLAQIINSFLNSGHHNTHVWVRVPLSKDDDCGKNDTWKWWNKFRTLCNYHNRIGLALEITPDLPEQLSRWPGEPVRTVVIPTSLFIVNKKGFPVLTKAHQQLMSSLFKLECQVIIDGKRSCSQGNVHVYHQYINYLYHNVPPTGQYESFSRGYEDYLQSPLQPLMDNLESSTYEIFEKDPVKYAKYQEAIHRCLLDLVPESKASSSVCVVMVLGAGRGPLVRMSLTAAKKAGRRIRCYAVEKNRNAAILLEQLKVTEWKGDDVHVVSADMRYWEAPELADVIVSELLGSFGDNELSPECLDGANRFLKPNGISIPQSYTSYVSPVSSHKLYNEIMRISSLEKSKPVEAPFETPYVVRIHNYHKLTDPTPFFTFNHPNWHFDGSNPNPEFYGDTQEESWQSKFRIKVDNELMDGVEDNNDRAAGSSGISQKKNRPLDNKHNARHRKLTVTIPYDTVLHGFAGYFRCALYKDVEISIEPSTHSPGMFSWFPIFFPLQRPIPLNKGCTLEAGFWRCCNEQKVWYEWAILSPQESYFHNVNGRSYTIGL